MPKPRPALFKWRHFEAEIIVCAVRWYLRFSHSYRDVEELLIERGLPADRTCAVVPGTVIVEPVYPRDLMDSPLMQPYLKAAGVILQLPSCHSKNVMCVWGGSALKWAFADFDNLNVALDRETLSPEDRKRVAESLKHRPMQFCIFLNALLSAEEMQQIMIHAIKVARQVP